MCAVSNQEALARRNKLLGDVVGLQDREPRLLRNLGATVCAAAAVSPDRFEKQLASAGPEFLRIIVAYRESARHRCRQGIGCLVRGAQSSQLVLVTQYGQVFLVGIKRMGPRAGREDRSAAFVSLAEGRARCRLQVKIRQTVVDDVDCPAVGNQLVVNQFKVTRVGDYCVDPVAVKHALEQLEFRSQVLLERIFIHDRDAAKIAVRALRV